MSGDQVAFANEERGAKWCGRPDRSCVDCRTSIAGSSEELRCADRVMTERLADRILTLGRLVKQKYSNKSALACWMSVHCMKTLFIFLGQGNSLF